MTRAFSVLVLLFAGLSVFGQTATDIDTRGKPATEPTGHVLQSSCRLDEDNATLKAVFVINDMYHLTTGERFDYELEITNRGRAPVVIPRALNWEDIQTRDGEPFSWASLDIRVDAGDGLQGSLPYALKLYAARDKPWSEVVLEPGERVRILGSDMLPVSMNINAMPVGKATLKAIFHLGTMRLYQTPAAGDPDAYRTESRWSYAAVAGEAYPIDLETKP
jgi:hypothetical protein